MYFVRKLPFRSFMHSLCENENIPMLGRWIVP